MTHQPELNPAVSAPPGAPQQLASWGQRVAATILEMFLLMAAVVVLWLPVSLVSDTLAGLVGLGVMALFLYWQFQNGSCGQSPGKALLGLKVVSVKTAAPIGGGLGLVRYLVATALSVFTCGLASIVDYLFPLWDSRRQTLHDKAVGSVVLANQPRRAFAELLKP